MAEDSYWSGFLDEHLFDTRPEPMVLGISMMGPSQVLVGLLVARRSKAKWPRTRIVAGGTHVSALIGDIAREGRYGKYIDCFIPGQGEEPLARIILAWKGMGEDPPLAIVRAGQGALDLPELLMPKHRVPIFDASELSLYPSDQLSLPYLFSRGCPYGKCAMCTYTVIEKRYRKGNISIAAPMALQALESCKLSRLSIKDSFFTRKMMRDLGGYAHGRFTWSATTKAARWMTHEEMRWMYAAGCRTLEFGIETIHPRLQAMLAKPLPMDVIEGAIDAATRAGISVVINLIYGLPGETERDALEQLEWFRGWKRRHPKLIFGSHNLLEVNRGSRMAIHPERFGIQLVRIGPWAFSYAWNAPAWRESFEQHLRIVTED